MPSPLGLGLILLVIFALIFGCVMLQPLTMTLRQNEVRATQIAPYIDNCLRSSIKHYRGFNNNLGSQLWICENMSNRVVSAVVICKGGCDVSTYIVNTWSSWVEFGQYLKGQNWEELKQ
jgi:hypothetical protein